MVSNVLFSTAVIQHWDVLQHSTSNSAWCLEFLIRTKSIIDLADAERRRVLAWPLPGLHICGLAYLVLPRSVICFIFVLMPAPPITLPVDASSKAPGLVKPWKHPNTEYQVCCGSAFGIWYWWFSFFFLNSTIFFFHISMAKNGSEEIELQQVLSSAFS